MLCDYFYFLLYIDGGFSNKVLSTFNFQLRRENILIFIIIEIFLLVFFVYTIFYVVSFKRIIELERVSSYECGFDLNSKTRVSFSYRFFLISILFLVFDVEIALMLPVPYFSFSMGAFFFLVFLVILVAGLLFEYFSGILNWL